MDYKMTLQRIILDMRRELEQSQQQLDRARTRYKAGASDECTRAQAVADVRVYTTHSAALQRYVTMFDTYVLERAK